jgi:hypothetical protein
MAWLHMIPIIILPISICQTQMKFLSALSATSAPTIRLSTVNDCLAVKASERKKMICELLKVRLIFKEQMYNTILGPDFVGSFAYKEHIYFWYREKAAESVDNNQERQTYSR